MKYNTFTLSSGLRVIHLPSSSPVVYCGFQIAAGTRNELLGEEGLAHFCEHMSFKGTARRSALQIISSLEELGGELNAYTNKESTVYYSAIQKDHLRTAVDVLADMVFHSEYPQQEIDREVEVVCDEIESYNDTPSELIFDDFENVIFENHPLGHNILGSAARLHTFTTADCKRFTERCYRPENMVFFAYGDVDFHRLLSWLEGYVATNGGAMSEGSTLCTGENHQEALLPVLQPGVITRNKKTHQSHVIIGTRAYPYGHPRRMALFLLNNLLGGPGMNSRLNLSLRERNGLVYTVESSLVSYGDTGAWAVYFGCDQHDVNRCCRLVRRELDKLMSAPLTKTRLAIAKRQLKGQLAIACDNREQFALDFGKIFLFDGRERDLEELFCKIDNVTADDVQAVANELFQQERLVTLIYK